MATKTRLDEGWPELLDDDAKVPRQLALVLHDVAGRVVLDDSRNERHRDG